MTQRLLATRFQLTFHHETRELEVYRLTLAKAGSKIKELGPNPGDIVFTDRHAGHLSAQQMPMSQLAGKSPIDVLVADRAERPSEN